MGYSEYEHISDVVTCTYGAPNPQDACRETFWCQPVVVDNDDLDNDDLDNDDLDGVDLDDEHFVFDAGVDPDAVEQAIRRFHAEELLPRLAAAGLTVGSLGSFDGDYLVLSDGRWHLDLFQAYLMQEGEPHLTPREWLERKIASIQARTR